MSKVKELIEIYAGMTDEQLNEEIDSFFEIGFALLERCESDAIESYPTTNVKLRFSCEVMQDANGKYYC